MSCYYCGRNLTDCGGTLKTKDHVIPVTFGGVNRKINIVNSCKDCNALKGGKTLFQFIVFVKRKIHRGKKVVNYTPDQLEKIIKNAQSLIDNCFRVYEGQLFIDKYHYEYYRDNYAV